MSALAERLGVRVAVLYNYVKGREELISLAARHAISTQPFPEDVGQDWRDYALAYARAAYDLFHSDAQLLPLVMNGKLSPAIKIDSVESWLETMTKHGFAAGEALSILKAVDTLVMGSAVLASHARSYAADYSVSVRDTVNSRPPAELPLLVANLDSFAAIVDPENWERSLQMLVDGIDAQKRVGGSPRS
ncbi:hypothetical protein EP837_03656 [Sphingobium sp. EP60837]|nr:hypothetical protein EP837_03656 [Sphingobium sp. EP60837]